MVISAHKRFMNQREASKEYSRIKRCFHAVHNKRLNDCDDLIFVPKLISFSLARDDPEVYTFVNFDFKISIIFCKSD